MLTIASALFGFLKRHGGTKAAARPGWRFRIGHAHEDRVSIMVDDERVEASEGECLAVALAVAGVTTLRHSPVAGGPRGVFCLMGSCQECLVHVDGAPVLACMEAVRPGMRVTLDRLTRERPATSKH